MPLYNYAHFVEDAVLSTLGQEGVDVRVVVVDDGSTDSSLDVVTRLAEKDDRVRVVANSQNIGHIPTVNKGMSLVDSEFVVKLDADDMLTPGSLARSVAALDAFPAAGLVYGFPVSFSGDSPPTVSRHVRSWTRWAGRRWLAMRCQRGVNRIYQPEAMMRTDVLRRAGQYRPELPHTSDFEMWLRLAELSDVVRVNGAAQGFYRSHSASMSHTVNAGILRDIRERLRAFDSFFDHCALEQRERERLRLVAHRRLAKEALGYAISYYARGVEPDESFDQYRQFACEAWPAAESSQQWKALRRTSSLSPARLRADPAVVIREKARAAAYAYRWHRFRRFGV